VLLLVRPVITSVVAMEVKVWDGFATPARYGVMAYPRMGDPLFAAGAFHVTVAAALP
jgi:hypothetical protein